MSTTELVTVTGWGRNKRAQGMRIDEKYFRDLVSSGRVEGAVTMSDGRIYVPKSALEAAIPAYERHRALMREQSSRKAAETARRRGASMNARIDEIERRLEKLERFI